MDKKYKVYAHINKINNKMYIGMTTLSLNKRSGLRGQRYKDSPRFDNEIKEFGWENFEHMTLRDNLTKEEANEVEREYIKLFATQDPEFGYNTAAGGFSLYGKENLFYGKHHNEKTKEAVRESNRRRIWTDEVKQRVREKLRGGNSPRAIAVYCLENCKTYPSISDASRELGLEPIKIVEICKGKRVSAKGYRFEYADKQRLNA